MPLEELIRAVAVRSANDAAAAIAEHVAGTEEEFVRLMNERARQLGMKNSRFVNSHGLYHSEHYMSAYDTALLSRHIVLHEPEILDYTGRWEDHIRVGTEDEQWLVNTNKLIKRYQGVDGLKTGWSGSESGWCVSATARRGETRFVAVIMKGPSAKVRFEEAAKLLNYGFANFESVLVASANSVLGTIPVDEGNVNEVKAVLPDTFGVTVKKGQAKKLERTVALADYITAPVKEGDRVGEVVVELEGEKVAQAELVADASVERISWLGLFVRNLRRAWPIQVD
jgi:D-alanyl-D-alanine carboxypeptidase (penicillin-binding protein 5/6)